MEINNKRIQVINFDFMSIVQKTLHYFNLIENSDKLLSDSTYTDIIFLTKIIIVNKLKYKDNNFEKTFEIVTILIFCFFYNPKDNLHLYSKINKNIKQKLLDIFIKDIDHSLRLAGIGDNQIGKYVKSYVKKFYFRIKKLDLIFVSNSIENSAKFENYLKNFDLLNTRQENNMSAELFKDLYKFINLSKLKENKDYLKIGLFN